MGWEIVREQHRNEPGKWSRLWLPNHGTQAVEGIMINMPKQQGILQLNGKSFLNMGNLRLLKISNVQLSDELEYLSNELRLLKWRGYPSHTLPSVISNPTNVNEFEVRCSFTMKARTYVFGFAIASFTVMESDHLWLGYVSLEEINKRHSDQSENLSIASCIHAEFLFMGREYTYWNGNTVKRCGIRLLYKQDLENFDEGLQAMEDSIFEQKHDVCNASSISQLHMETPSVLEGNIKNCLFFQGLQQTLSIFHQTPALEQDVYAACSLMLIVPSLELVDSDESLECESAMVKKVPNGMYLLTEQISGIVQNKELLRCAYVASLPQVSD
ncbi:hypothetical protein JRO89_XS07G0285100 [Xanthoceras sorbifolium]|uniref:Uncharacterized protein n=1 Tax=Xanthoceras sorbifolium TaxID=99658 RepID=A0ABQ8HVI8_9ROSI|nr:hypothetical protein JRO89_XS07G0285100 [Xanthoceras sorbifolium]